MLAEQVEQRRFDRGHRVDGRAQVEGLQAAAAGVAVGELLLHRAAAMPCSVADRLADHERPRVLERLPDLLAARHFADAGVAGAVA